MLFINVCYSVFILPDPVLITGILIAFAVLLSWKLGLFKNISPEIIIANGVLLFYFSAFILMYPLLMPNPGKQMVNALYHQGISANDKVYVYGNIRAASNIRIQSKNQLNVVSMDTIFTLPENSNHFLVFDEKEQNKLNLSNYEVFKGSEEWMRVPVSKFPKFLQLLVEKIKNSGTKYYIAKPRKSR